MMSRCANVKTIFFIIFYYFLLQGTHMKRRSLYSDAHLFVAAIRILENQHLKNPTIKGLCDLLSISIEKGNLIARKLLDLNIIEKISGGYETRFTIINHVKIEEIPRDEQEDGISKEIKKFIAGKTDYTKKIELIKAESEKKKKELFAGIDTQLKQNISKTLTEKD